MTTEFIEDTNPEIGKFLKTCIQNKVKVYITEDTIYLAPDGKQFIQWIRNELPKRNDPCHCGTNKKFKKCCGQ